MFTYGRRDQRLRRSASGRTAAHHVGTLRRHLLLLFNAILANCMASKDFQATYAAESRIGLYLFTERVSHSQFLVPESRLLLRTFDLSSLESGWLLSLLIYDY